MLRSMEVPMTRLLLLLALTTAACSGDDEVVDPTDVTDTDDDTAQDFTAGATVYADNCAGCHGAEGTGAANGPDLTGLEKNEAEVKDQVLNGGPGMPAIDVTDQEATDVAAYVVDKHG